MGIVWGAVPAALRAADLTSSEKQYYDGAKKYLTQLQQNLKLARDTAGPGEDQPPASKAKLAQARLQSARQSAANVAARLEKLPADNEEVKSLQSDYDEAMKAIAALDDRLAGKNQKPAGEKPAAPGDKAADAPANAAAPPPAKEERLGYQDENALKIAQSNVDQVVGEADALNKVVAPAKAGKTPATDTLRRAMASIENARRRAGFANDQFKKLPAGHSRVKAAADELKTAVARVDAAEKVLDPLSKAATKRGDATSYPDLTVDTDRLKELTGMLTTGNLQANRTAAAELVKQLPALKEEGDRLLKKYAPLLGEKTQASNDLQASAKRLNYQVGKFEEALAKEKQALPQQIDADLAQITTLAEQAVKEQKPAFFGGGIASNFKFAEDKLILYEALDPAGAAAAKAKLDQTREAVKKQEASLAGAIIAANELPSDTYSGPDKADLVRRATDAVKKQDPKAVVLAVRIPKAQWERETKWRYENREWRKIDRSRLQAEVVVKRDDKHAEMRPVNLWTDHVNNDAPSAIPVFDVKDEPSPGNLLLLAKVK
jgi:hypothetical protein